MVVLDQTPSVPAGYNGAGYYPWTALENMLPVDLLGDGSSSVFMAFPTGPTGCSYRAFSWGAYANNLGLGMTDLGSNLPGYVFNLQGCSNFASNSQKVQFFFLDSDGDNRPDFATFKLPSPALFWSGMPTLSSNI